MLRIFGLTFGATGRLKTESERLFIAEAVIPGIVAGVAYAANDAVGTVFSVDAPKVGRIMWAHLADPDDDTLSLTLHIFRERFTGAADNADYTAATVAADAYKHITSIAFSTVSDHGAFKVSEALAEAPYRSPSGKLWLQAATGATPTIAAGLLPVIQLGILPAAEA